MNERIKELAFQSANGMLSFDEDGFRLSEKEVEKFAELIVKECASMVRAYGSHKYDFTGDLELDEFMLKHFGVE